MTERTYQTPLFSTADTQRTQQTFRCHLHSSSADTTDTAEGTLQPTHKKQADTAGNDNTSDTSHRGKQLTQKESVDTVGTHSRHD